MARGDHGQRGALYSHLSGPGPLSLSISGPKQCGHEIPMVQAEGDFLHPCQLPRMGSVRRCPRLCRVFVYFDRQPFTFSQRHPDEFRFQAYDHIRDIFLRSLAYCSPERTIVTRGTPASGTGSIRRHIRSCRESIIKPGNENLPHPTNPGPERLMKSSSPGEEIKSCSD